MRWTVHSEKTLYQDEWLDIRVADVELPDGRHLEHRLIKTPPGAGCVVVQDGQVLLLWRHRFITGSEGWEIPVGKIEPGEDPAAAAARETEEETGWRPGPLRFLLRTEPTPGLSDSAHSIYLADGAERIGSPEDDFESDSVSWVALAGVPTMISRGDITSGTTLAALLFVIVHGQQLVLSRWPAAAGAVGPVEPQGFLGSAPKGAKYSQVIIGVWPALEPSKLSFGFGSSVRQSA